MVQVVNKACRCVGKVKKSRSHMIPLSIILCAYRDFISMSCVHYFICIKMSMLFDSNFGSYINKTYIHGFLSGNYRVILCFVILKILCTYFKQVRLPFSSLQIFCQKNVIKLKKLT